MVRLNPITVDYRGFGVVWSPNAPPRQGYAFRDGLVCEIRAYFDRDRDRDTRLVDFLGPSAAIRVPLSARRWRITGRPRSSSCYPTVALRTA